MRFLLLLPLLAAGAPPAPVAVLPASAWIAVTGAPAGARDIAADDLGNVYLTTTEGKIYKGTNNGQTWSQFWTADGNGPLYYGASSIATNGVSTYVTDVKGRRYSTGLTGKWVAAGSTPGLKDIALTKSNKCWAVSTLGGIYTLQSVLFTQEQGSDGVRIAAAGVAGKEQIWLSNTVGNVYRAKWNGHFYAWEQMPGSSVGDVAVGEDGTVWCTNTDGAIFKWNGTGWTRLSGSDASRITVGARTAWIVNTAGKVYRLPY